MSKASTTVDEIHQLSKQYLQTYSLALQKITECCWEVELPAALGTKLFPQPITEWLQKQSGQPTLPTRHVVHFRHTPSTTPLPRTQGAIYPGSPLAQALLTSAQQEGRFSCLYEQTTTGRGSRFYTPWLWVHFFITEERDCYRRRLWNGAINCNNNQILLDPHTPWSHRIWQNTPQAGVPFAPAHQKLVQAVGQLEEQILQQLEQEDLGWAWEAAQHFQVAQQELSNLPVSEAEWSRYTAENEARYLPRVSVTVAAAALCYLLN